MIWAWEGGGGFNSCKETSICNQLNLIRVLPVLTSFDSEVFKGQGEGPQDGVWFPPICQDKKLWRRDNLKRRHEGKGSKQTTPCYWCGCSNSKKNNQSFQIQRKCSPKVIPIYIVWVSLSPKLVHLSVSKKLRCSCCLILWYSQQ